MAKALLLCHDTIIVDATNVNSRARNEWRKAFPEAKLVWKVFETTPEVCKERAINTKQEDLIPVIDRMWGKFKSPKEDTLYSEREETVLVC